MRRASKRRERSAALKTSNISFWSIMLLLTRSNLLDKPPVHRKRLARDEAGSVAHEEKGNLGDVLGRANAAEWCVPGKGSPYLLALDQGLVDHLGIDHTGAERIGTQAARPVGDGDRPRQGNDRAFARRIGVRISTTPQRCDRSGIKDHATTPFDQHGDTVLTEEEHSTHVDVENAAPVFLGAGQNVAHGNAEPPRGRVADASVVVENVEAAARVLRCGEPTADVR